MGGTVGERAYRIGIVAMALGVIAAAVLWVSVVRFKDDAATWDCGVPIGAAWHGRQAPTIPVFTGTNPQVVHADSGLFSVPVGTPVTRTVCAGQARTRVAFAAGAVVIATVFLAVSLRPRRPLPPAATV